MNMGFPILHPPDITLLHHCNFYCICLGLVLSIVLKADAKELTSLNVRFLKKAHNLFSTSTCLPSFETSVFMHFWHLAVYYLKLYWKGIYRIVKNFSPLQLINRAFHFKLSVAGLDWPHHKAILFIVCIPKNRGMEWMDRKLCNVEETLLERRMSNLVLSGSVEVLD